MPVPRPTIRALLALIAVSGLCLALARSLAPLLAMPAVLAAHSMVGWVCSLVLGYGLSQAIGWGVRTTRSRISLAIALILTVVLTGYLAWAFHRAESYSSAINDEEFPYPDRMINGSERWLDARRPIPPGNHGLSKTQGAYPLVSLILGTSVATLMTTIGLSLGALIPAGPVSSQADPGANSPSSSSSQAKRDGPGRVASRTG